MLSSHQLIEEANRLARPGVLLIEDGQGEPAAYWHGSGTSEPSISIRMVDNWLWVSVSPVDGCIVQFQEKPLVSEKPLFATPFLSLPPPDALFRLGSPIIGEYLEENGWERDWEFNSNFPSQSAHDYEKYWQQNCPIYSNTVFAYTGGWNFPWPDGDFWDTAMSELVVCTIADAEPWLEVFHSPSGFQSFQRVT